ncbi:hypothetical protein M8494_05365 [Serratia ureilytica]
MVIDGAVSLPIGNGWPPAAMNSALLDWQPAAVADGHNDDSVASRGDLHGLRWLRRPAAAAGAGRLGGSGPGAPAVPMPTRIARSLSPAWQRRPVDN